MSMTYATCQGMRSERTARGGRDGCRASVQSYDGSIIISNYYNSDGILIVRVGTNEGSATFSDYKSSDFIGSFKEFNELLKLYDDIKNKKIKLIRHREQKKEGL